MLRIGCGWIYRFIYEKRTGRKDAITVGLNVPRGLRQSKTPHRVPVPARIAGRPWDVTVKYNGSRIYNSDVFRTDVTKLPKLLGLGPVIRRGTSRSRDFGNSVTVPSTVSLSEMTLSVPSGPREEWGVARPECVTPVPISRAPGGVGAGIFQLPPKWSRSYSRQQHLWYVRAETADYPFVSVRFESCHFFSRGGISRNRKVNDLISFLELRWKNKLIFYGCPRWD